MLQQAQLTRCSQRRFIHESQSEQLRAPRARPARTARTECSPNWRGAGASQNLTRFRPVFTRFSPVFTEQRASAARAARLSRSNASALASTASALRAAALRRPPLPPAPARAQLRNVRIFFVGFARLQQRSLRWRHARRLNRHRRRHCARGFGAGADLSGVRGSVGVATRAHLAQGQSPLANHLRSRAPCRSVAATHTRLACRTLQPPPREPLCEPAMRAHYASAPCERLGLEHKNASAAQPPPRQPPGVDGLGHARVRRWVRKWV